VAKDTHHPGRSIQPLGSVSISSSLCVSLSLFFLSVFLLVLDPLVIRLRLLTSAPKPSYITIYLSLGQSSVRRKLLVLAE